MAVKAHGKTAFSRRENLKAREKMLFSVLKSQNWFTGKPYVILNYVLYVYCVEIAKKYYFMSCQKCIFPSYFFVFLNVNLFSSFSKQLLVLAYQVFCIRCTIFIAVLFLFSCF